MSYMNQTQKSNYDDLVAQAEMFGMEVDWEAVKLVPVKPIKQSPNSEWLDRWIYFRTDKQWSHEIQNNDGGR